MKIVLQRVKNAKVEVEGKLISQIEKGLLLLLGVEKGDDESKIEYLAKKCIGLRIFEDSKGKMNLSVEDIEGEIMLVSQFTLCAKTKKGRRPDFTSAAPPELAEQYYLKFAEELENLGLIPQLGIFGTHMNISFTNDGPVTIILEK